MRATRDLFMYTTLWFISLGVDKRIGQVQGKVREHVELLRGP